MKNLITLECNPTDPSQQVQELANAIERGCWVQLFPTTGEKNIIPSDFLPKGPGVVLSSGGSCSGPHHCLQPCSHLDQSAIATGQWLREHGLEPKDSIIFNPLPLHHVSGLMPWWRSRIWGSKHTWLTPALMRDPIALEKSCESLLQKKIGPILISLVPTHIQRLLNHPIGLRWLQYFDVIWVGGSALSEKLANYAREKKIRLAPCYGSTETAAMVTALDPNAFLAGKRGCGNPLRDVQLRLNKNGALEVRTPRLASARWTNGHLVQLRDKEGWWQSGDSAKLTLENSLHQLEIIGRLDTAIHSGGETIFPEILEIKILKIAQQTKLPIDNLIFLPIPDTEWGERLIGLVRWESKVTKVEQQRHLKTLKKHVAKWLPAQRPLAWHGCPDLAPNAAGKWERSKWKDWLNNLIK